MTLKYLAETFSKEYDFRIFDENGKNLGRYERNEIVKLDYKVAEFEVLKFKPSTIQLTTYEVVVKRG